jgi:hypothetical protein
VIALAVPPEAIAILALIAVFTLAATAAAARP